MKQYPDSALILLDSIIRTDNLTMKQHYDYTLLLIQTKDKLHKNISSDTIIFDVKDFYIKDNDIENIALATFYCGRVLQEKGKYKEAVNEYLEADKYANNINDYNLLGLINTAIGSISLLQLPNNDAISYLSKATIYFKRSKNVKNEIDALNMIGSAYLKKSANDSAFSYYNKAKILAQDTNDTLQLASSYQCIGVAYLQTKKLEEAKISFKKSLVLFHNNPIGQAATFLNLATVFEKEKSMDSARYFMEKSVSIQKQYANNRLLCGTYLTISEIEESSYNYQMALAYYKNYNKSLVSIYKEDENTKITELQKKYRFEVVENENNRLILQRQQIVLFSSFALLVISLIAIFAMIKSFKNKKAVLLAEKASLESEKTIVEAEKTIIEAERKIYQLMEIAKSFDKKENTFRNVLLQHFNILKKAALLEQYTRGENEQDQRLIKIFNEIVYGQESLNWDILYKTMNVLHKGFFDRLKNEYPQLDEQEFRICCLTYTKFSSAEIALIMELKTNTIQMKRSSIRKKMKIEPLGSISDFLDVQLNVSKKPIY
jgi:tetratricopeptide (TPR) repeat protein